MNKCFAIFTLTALCTHSASQAMLSLPVRSIKPVGRSLSAVRYASSIFDTAKNETEGIFTVLELAGKGWYPQAQKELQVSLRAASRFHPLYQKPLMVAALLHQIAPIGALSGGIKDEPSSVSFLQGKGFGKSVVEPIMLLPDVDMFWSGKMSPEQEEKFSSYHGDAVSLARNIALAERDTEGVVQPLRVFWYPVFELLIAGLQEKACADGSVQPIFAFGSSATHHARISDGAPL